MNAVRLPALVGLGGNLGDPVARMREAAAALAVLGAGPGALRVSRPWRSAPVDCPPGSPDFVNAVVRIEVAGDTEPAALLERLLALEAGAGRVRTVRNAPRPLDLDLLLLGGAIVDAPGLELPHPRATARAFVLLPAAEVAAELRWPGTERTIGELAADCDRTGVAPMDDVALDPASPAPRETARGG